MSLKGPYDVMQMSTEREPFSRLYDDMESIIGKRTVTPGNIISLVTLLMKTADKYTDITGIQKKELVLAVTRKVVEETVPEEERGNILYMVDGALPSVIDTLIAVDKGQLAIKIKKSFKTWCSCCT